MATRSDETQPAAHKDTHKRRTAVRGVLLIVLAVGAAIGAAVLLTRYMDARVAAARVPTAKVVVAKVDIPVATPIKSEWLDVVAWPLSGKPAGSFEDPAAIVNQVAMTPITRGEAVLPSKLVSANARAGLATLVPDGMRAVSVRVDDVIGVAGFIRPGDHVDVIATMKPREEASFMAKIVLQNVRVAAIGKELEVKEKGAGSDKSKSTTVATLVVTSEESERLALASEKGAILLSLRGIGDEEFAETNGITPPKLLLTDVPEPAKPVAVGAEKAKPKRIVRREPKQEEKTAANRQVVEILRGDLFEKRAFESQEKKQ